MPIEVGRLFSLIIPIKFRKGYNLWYHDDKFSSTTIKKLPGLPVSRPVISFPDLVLTTFYYAL